MLTLKRHFDVFLIAATRLQAVNHSCGATDTNPSLLFAGFPWEAMKNVPFGRARCKPHRNCKDGPLPRVAPCPQVHMVFQYEMS